MLGKSYDPPHKSPAPQANVKNYTPANSQITPALTQANPTFAGDSI